MYRINSLSCVCLTPYKIKDISIFFNFAIYQMKRRAAAERKYLFIFLLLRYLREDGALHKNNLKALIVFRCKEHFQDCRC